MYTRVQHARLLYYQMCENEIIPSLSYISPSLSAMSAPALAVYVVDTKGYFSHDGAGHGFFLTLVWIHASCSFMSWTSKWISSYLLHYFWYTQASFPSRKLHNCSTSLVDICSSGVKGKCILQHTGFFIICFMNSNWPNPFITARKKSEAGEEMESEGGGESKSK